MNNDDGLISTLAWPWNHGDTDADIDDKPEDNDKKLIGGSDSEFVDTVNEPDQDNENDEYHEDGSVLQNGFNSWLQRSVNYSFRAVPLDLLNKTVPLKKALHSDGKVK